jgi:hypothetical protein
MPDGYQQDARPFVSSAQPDRVTVTLDMDADLLDWLQKTRFGRAKFTTCYAPTWKST